MTSDQGEFNFDGKGSDAGYWRWREELEEKKRAFEARWGVIFGRRVRVCLRDHEQPLVGLLEWLEPLRKLHGAAPTFRLRGMEFSAGEIQSIVREEDVEDAAEVP